MLTDKNQEIDDLKKEISKIYGGRISTTNDFIELADAIKEKTGQPISDSTLKRLWGYVNYNPQPHTATLNVIAQYIGFRTFREFCNSRQISSAFFTCDRIEVKELAPEDLIILGWSPDREVMLKYLGNLQFTVTDGGTSKLEAGDVLEASEFLKGVPMFFGKVVRDGKELPAYVAGKAMGISKLEMVY